MKTKVRTIETEWNKNYKELFIEILDYRYERTKDYLEPIGSIRFLQAIDRPEYGWFAMKFVVETDRPQHLSKMAKLAQYIQENSNNAKPDEIKLLIGADEYFSYECEFIPVSYKGMQYYRVMTGSNAENFYSRIFAPNEIKANKMLEKMVKERNIQQAQIKFHSVVS